MDIAHLRQWVGKTETRIRRLEPFQAEALAATLDHDDLELVDRAPLPPLWHWTYFATAHRMSDVGHDGHPRRGGFLPPVDLPRRMWAGGTFDFRHPLRLGDTVRQESRVLSVDVKEGRTGPLVFVRVGHEFSDGDGLALAEEHDIVYRGGTPAGSPPRSAPPGAAWERTVRPDPVLLFRYSALTFNGHRIHYDQPYATSVEGYPGLVVHGPLIATLLLDLLRREWPDAIVERFSFRAVGPLFDTAEFAVCGAPAPDGRSVALWARSSDGWLAMEASASVRRART